MLTLLLLLCFASSPLLCFLVVCSSSGVKSRLSLLASRDLHSLLSRSWQKRHTAKICSSVFNAPNSARSHIQSRSMANRFPSFFFFFTWLRCDCFQERLELVSGRLCSAQLGVVKGLLSCEKQISKARFDSASGKAPLQHFAKRRPTNFLQTPLKSAGGEYLIL